MTLYRHKNTKRRNKTTKLHVDSPVQCVEGFLTALHFTLKRLLLGVNADVDLETVRGEEGLSTALLITHKRVLAPVSLLVRPQVSRRTVRPGAALKHALVALHLQEEVKVIILTMWPGCSGTVWNHDEDKEVN